MPSRPNIVEWEESWKMLLSSNRSLSRVGDGEMMIAGSKGGPSFQRRDLFLAECIRQVLSVPNENCFVGVNRIFFYHDCESASNSNLRWMRDTFLPQLKSDGLADICTLPLYLDAAMTIPRKTYPHSDESAIASMFRAIRQHLRGRRLVLVTSPTEPNLSFWRMGDYELVECPSANAWDVRGKIKDDIRKANPGGDKLVILQCGPTASVLAWELASEMTCWDMGHLSAEWCGWMAGKTPTQDWKEFFDR